MTTGSSRGASTAPAPDAALCSAVSRGISSALRLLAVRAEGCAAGSHSGSAVAIADHCVPTPAQQLNLALAARLDDVRVAVASLLADVAPPQPLALLLPTDEAHPTIAALSAERSGLHPLRPRYPPALLAAAHILRVGRGTPEGDLVSQVRASCLQDTRKIETQCVHLFLAADTPRAYRLGPRSHRRHYRWIAASVAHRGGGTNRSAACASSHWVILRCRRQHWPPRRR